MGGFCESLLCTKQYPKHEHASIAATNNAFDESVCDICCVVVDFASIVVEDVVVLGL